MRRIFQNYDYELAITLKGYAVIHNLIPENICDELKEYFEKNDVVDHRPFTISNWNNNEEYRKAAFTIVSDLLQPFAEKILENYKPVLAVITAKRPDAKSDMLLHQDWSLVDETKYRSVSIWVALCDMTYVNGNLQIAEGSHIYAGTPRGINVPIPFEDIRHYMHEHCLTDLPLTKGDAIIFDHRLVHASPPNLSAQLRLAAVLALIPAEADLIHYYKPLDTQTELEILKLNPAEFRLLDFFDIPNKPRHIETLGRVPATLRQLTKEEVLEVKSLK